MGADTITEGAAENQREALQIEAGFIPYTSTDTAQELTDERF